MSRSRALDDRLRAAYSHGAMTMTTPLVLSLGLILLALPGLPGASAV